jgi:hypothetical protein
MQCKDIKFLNTISQIIKKNITSIYFFKGLKIKIVKMQYDTLSKNYLSDVEKTTQNFAEK